MHLMLYADIDECLTDNGGCHVNADCLNSVGSFRCECKLGYSGDGYSDCTGKETVCDV